MNKMSFGARPFGRILTLPPIHKYDLAANRSHDGLSPSPPLKNGGAGRGEVALISLASGAVSSCAPSLLTTRFRIASARHPW